MDKPISKQQIRKERNKKLIKYGAIFLGVIIAFVLMLNFITTAIPSKNLIMGTIDRGNLSVTVGASGKIIPLSEKNIVAPISTQIVEVYKNSGDSVSKGEPILLLELSSVDTQYKKKLDELKIRKSKLVQSQIALDNKISELQVQYQVKELQSNQMKTDLTSERYLDSIGASTKDKIREKELNYEVSKLELTQLKQKIENEKKNAEAELQVQQLEYSIEEKSLLESEKLLKDARILSPQDGILSFVNNELGTQVNIGEKLAVLSDLSHFKVEAEVADTYVDRLTFGANTIIKLGNEKFAGTVVNVTPASQNGTVKFVVSLNNASNNKLKSGLRVDVNVEYGLKEDVLRIPTFSNYAGAGKYDIWVVEGETATKRKVTLGESSYEYIEVVEGLNMDDKVILSNMGDYKNKTDLKIKL